MRRKQLKRWKGTKEGKQQDKEEKEEENQEKDSEAHTREAQSVIQTGKQT